MSSANTFLSVTAVVASRTLRAVMELTERAARTLASVLIAGETGTGEEIVARGSSLFLAHRGGGVTRRSGAHG